MRVIKPWERQPGESREAYRAFSLYREIPDRSLRKTADYLRKLGPFDNASGNSELSPAVVVIDMEEMKGVDGASSERRWIPGRVYDWSAKHRWVARAQEWDAQVAREVEKIRRNHRVRMQIRQQNQMEAAAGSLSQPIAMFLKSLADPKQRARLETIPIEDKLGLAIECATRLPNVHKAERLAHGVLTQPEDEMGDAGQHKWVIREYSPPRKNDEEDLVEFLEGDDPYEPEGGWPDERTED